MLFLVVFMLFLVVFMLFLVVFMLFLVVFMLFLVVFLFCESAGRRQESEAKVRVFFESARVF
jgi:hypothetical protein